MLALCWARLASRARFSPVCLQLLCFGFDTFKTGLPLFTMYTETRFKT